MELPLPTKTPITTGTKLCGKVQQIVFNMTEAFGEWKCRLDPLGSRPLTSAPSVAAFAGLFACAVSSILAQSSSKVAPEVHRQVLPLRKSPSRTATKRDVWETYATEFHSHIHRGVRSLINELHHASKPVVVYLYLSFWLLNFVFINAQLICSQCSILLPKTLHIFL